MLDPSKQAFDAWRTADGEARSVEARLADAWQRYFARQSPPPPEDLFSEVARARFKANEKLTQAMARMSTELSREHPR